MVCVCVYSSMMYAGYFADEESAESIMKRFEAAEKFQVKNEETGDFYIPDEGRTDSYSTVEESRVE